MPQQSMFLIYLLVLPAPVRRESLAERFRIRKTRQWSVSDPLSPLKMGLHETITSFCTRYDQLSIALKNYTSKVFF